MDSKGNNCRVWSADDSSHVSQVSPLDTKKKELQETRAAMDPHEREQQDQNQKMREEGRVRPLGGKK